MELGSAPPPPRTCTHTHTKIEGWILMPGKCEQDQENLNFFTHMEAILALL